MSEFKDDLTDTAANPGEAADDAAERAPSNECDAWDSVQHRANQAVSEAAAYVRQNPIPAVLAVLACGVALGLVLNRREPESFEDRYIGKPLQKSRGILIGLLVAGGAVLRRTFRGILS